MHDSSEPTINKELQQLYVHMQMLEQQSKQLQKQIQSLDQQMEELETVKRALEELQHVPLDTEILVPLSGGIFVKAALKDNTNLLVNVGADTGVTKSVPDTISTITSQFAELQQLREQMQAQLERVIGKAQELEQHVEKMND